VIRYRKLKGSSVLNCSAA